MGITKGIQRVKQDRVIAAIEGITFDTTGLALESKQLPNNHEVTVSNPTPAPETGLAKEYTQGLVLEATDKLDGRLADGSAITQTMEMEPTDWTHLNPSITVTEVVDGTVTTKTITKTIGIASYVKTVAKDSSDNSVTISAWSEV